jgi:hypothetical protein
MKLDYIGNLTTVKVSCYLPQNVIPALFCALGRNFWLLLPSPALGVPF